MNDPWDVKCVRRSGQYLSCMKINGVPLLPPVLSKECHKEMQYYKLLAKEVEKRIALLKPYTIDSDAESSEDITDVTDAPELPESEHVCQESISPSPENDNFDKENVAVVQCNKGDYSNLNHTKSQSSLLMDLTLDLIGGNADDFHTPRSINNSPDSSVIQRDTQQSSEAQRSSQNELPERDYESPKKLLEKELITAGEIVQNKITKKDYLIDSVLCEPIPSLGQEGPSSLSSKSFTGSLNDLHTDSMRELQKNSKLIRQRSYTLLNPSPQLLAHLEVQSMSTGVEMTSISMSESLYNLSSPNKKRRSWDLETAKVKWSSMALELNTNGTAKSIAPKVQASAAAMKKAASTTQARRPKSVCTKENQRRSGTNSKMLYKSESAHKVKRTPSPLRNTSAVSNRSNAKEPTSPKNTPLKKDAAAKPLISETEDAAVRVRELYERIQKQQEAQMISLVEKQKREQLLLQQVFEEQNNMLLKQLKTICPESPIEVKEAWVDKISKADRGPVSLNQLNHINQKLPEQKAVTSPASCMLINATNNYMNHCDDVLKKSKVITDSLKKQHQTKSPTGAKVQSPYNGDGSRTRTHSPVGRNTSRKLNYESSVSTERDCEPILTDRTNDTMADLNVSLPSDPSDIFHDSTLRNMSVCPVTKVPKVNGNSVPNSSASLGNHIEAAIRTLEESLYRSISSCNRRQVKPQATVKEPTSKEREAATKIVAAAKGFLVRRLMRTERVQATVQTIRDALLCALQLHQDRAGIRGADVDLHRRLIQQITAACYTLHDSFIASSAPERCALIAADRERQRALAARQTPVPRPRSHRSSDV